MSENEIMQSCPVCTEGSLLMATETISSFCKVTQKPIGGKVESYEAEVVSQTEFEAPHSGPVCDSSVK